MSSARRAFHDNGRWSEMAVFGRVGDAMKQITSPCNARELAFLRSHRSAVSRGDLLERLDGDLFISSLDAHNHLILVAYWHF